MAIDIYSTARLIQAVEGINPASSFLRDTYFPSVAADVFNTEQVLVEYKDGDRRLAPVVTPYQNGFPMTRTGTEMSAYTPPTVAPKRPITLDDVTKRGFGEALFGEVSPQQRAQLLAMSDLSELDAAITRREEWMCAQVMTENGVTLTQIADDDAAGTPGVVRYYSEDSNPAAVSVTTKWDADGADILGDMADMVHKLTQAGLPAADFVCAPDVADAIVNDERVYRLLDNRRYQLGEVVPAVEAPGASLMCVLSVRGHNIRVISYDETYTDDSGAAQTYIAPGSGVMTAPRAGHMLYGAVSQIEQADGEFHTYGRRRVPKYVANADDNVRTLTLSARPLPAPMNKNPFIVAKSLLTA